MPVYHSAFNDDASYQLVCGCAMLPIKTTTRGPAPVAPEGEDDAMDEVINFFKANVLFKHFEVKGTADRTLIYLTLYITQCLKKLEGVASKADGVKALTAMAHETFLLPGDPGFSLGSFFPPPANSQEADLCRAYLKQIREEMGRRLIFKVYGTEAEPSKFWLVFAKRRFMNKTL